jgi:cardiolipin synthase
MLKSLPNWLTASRIIVIPLLVVVFFIPHPSTPWITWGLFVLASVTDYVDGWVARAFSAHTALGRFMDPVADKLLVASALLLLVSEQRAHVLPSIAILGREILVSGLREFLAEVRVSVPVSHLAKIKTSVQMTAIATLFLAPGLPWPVTIGWLGNLMLWGAAGLTVVTGYAYLKTGLAHMKESV